MSESLAWLALVPAYFLIAFVVMVVGLRFSNTDEEKGVCVAIGITWPIGVPMILLMGFFMGMVTLALKVTGKTMPE